MGGLAAGLALMSAMLWGAFAMLGMLVIAAITAMIGARLDATRRSVIVLYNLEPDTAAAYEALTKTFDNLAASSDKWRVDAGGAVRSARKARRFRYRNCSIHNETAG